MNGQARLSPPTAQDAASLAAQLHARYQGKIQVMPKCPLEDLRTLSTWYTPGVAEPCRRISRDADAAWDYTNKGNSVAIVTDGSRVLGLGDIGPLASLPVMEGKALLFKYLGGVDAIPICLDGRDIDELVRIVAALEPAFGGINLEDIAHPRCFHLLDALRARLRIPVWHDDQQGTAVVVLAALQGALVLLGKSLEAVQIALIGAGAANIAVYRLLRAAGVPSAHVILCDQGGLLHRDRRDIAVQAQAFDDKWRCCLETNPEGRRGGIEEAMRGADVCIAFARSDARTIRPSWVSGMARDPIVFACANPEPEIWPADAYAAGAAIVATGRGDFPNQVNNALAFPGVFRGVLDVRAATITDGMTLAAAQALADFTAATGLARERIVPRIDELDVYPRVAAAIGCQAQAEGVARLQRSHDDLIARATQVMWRAREGAAALVRSGVIEPMPGQDDHGKESAPGASMRARQDAVPGG